MTSTNASPPYDGTGVGVAVINRGITASPDLKTSKAGSVARNANQSTSGSYTYRIRGIAPNVSLVNLRVLDQNGLGTDSAVIAAIQRTIQQIAMLQKDPALTPATDKARPMKSAQKLPSAQTTAFDPTTGITCVSESRSIGLETVTTGLLSGLRIGSANVIWGAKTRSAGRSPENRPPSP